jgi:type III pantothenate kinase
VEIKNMLEAFGLSRDDIDDCIIASVVPPVFNSVQTGVQKVIGKQPMVVGPGLKTGLNIHVDIPSQVGSDLIVAAVAALAEYPAPLVLIDLGTATTIEVIEPENVFIGGLIFPGVMVSLDSLSAHAAQLPGISLDKPKRVVGKNTVDCMRSGMMYGTASMLDGIIDRIAEELGHESTVIATGGLAQFVIPLCKHEIILEKELLLKGLNIIYKKNKR